MDPGPLEVQHFLLPSLLLMNRLLSPRYSCKWAVWWNVLCWILISHLNITLWKPTDQLSLNRSIFHFEVIGSDIFLARLLTDYYNPFRPWWKPIASSKLCFVTTQVGKDVNCWGKSEILIEGRKKEWDPKKGNEKNLPKALGMRPLIALFSQYSRV